MSSALTLILTALTLSSTGSEVIQVDTNVYDVPSRAMRYFVQDFMNWNEAYKSCKNQSSHLVVINSQQEADDLAGISLMDTVHVGIHNKFMEGQYVAITGEDLESTGYAVWYDQEPNGGPNMCIAYQTFPSDMPELQGFMDVPCDMEYQSICEQRLWIDYDLISPHGHYKYHATAVTWQRAWQTCRQERAHLLIINSQAEISALVQYFGEFRYVWTGIHHAFSLGDFVTVYNGKLENTGWNFWLNLVIDPGRLFVSVFDNRGLFAELNGSEYGFICELETAQYS